MDHDTYPDSYIRGILNAVKTIAVVGISPKDNRPSYFAFKYLQERGYRMIPVNPGQAGQKILGQTVFAKLADIPEPIDMVDIFRGSEHALPIVQEALALSPRPQVIWMQLSVRNDEAARLADEAGLKVVMNRCPKIEYGRLVIGDFLDRRQFADIVVKKSGATRRRRPAHVDRGESGSDRCAHRQKRQEFALAASRHRRPVSTRRPDDKLANRVRQIARRKSRAHDDDADVNRKTQSVEDRPLVDVKTEATAVDHAAPPCAQQRPGDE